MEPHLHGKPIEEYVIEAEEMLGQIAELEATCEKQTADMEEAASLDAAQKFLFRKFAMEAESDLDVIQAAWCDFDAVVEALQAERDKLQEVGQELLKAVMDGWINPKSFPRQ